jgi:hypothetical protein
MNTGKQAQHGAYKAGSMIKNRTNTKPGKRQSNHSQILQTPRKKYPKAHSNYYTENMK